MSNSIIAFPVIAGPKWSARASVGLCCGLMLALGGCVMASDQAGPAAQRANADRRLAQNDYPDKRKHQSRAVPDNNRATAGTNGNSATLILRSGFENEVVTSPPARDAKYARMRMELASGKSGDVQIQYEGGTGKDRAAEVIADPTRQGNRVLQYWIENARIPGDRGGYYKGRIQLQFSDINKTAVFTRYRMYLHPDLNHYRSYPGANNWFNIMTLWVGDNRHPYPFKLSLNIGKDKGVGAPLYFIATGDIRTGGRPGYGKWETIWGDIGGKFEVPVGEWLDMEVGYRQGDKSSGRFYVAVKRASERSMHTVFDITNWTYHPQSPAPVPLVNWNPLKLYTSGSIIDHIRSKGGVARIYWDDLEIWDGWPR